MHYTEQQATTKVCPARQLKDDKLVYCVASACMLWRWELEHTDHNGHNPPEWQGHCGYGK